MAVLLFPAVKKWAVTFSSLCTSTSRISTFPPNTEPLEQNQTCGFNSFCFWIRYGDFATTGYMVGSNSNYRLISLIYKNSADFLQISGFFYLPWLKKVPPGSGLEMSGGCVCCCLRDHRRSVSRLSVTSWSGPRPHKIRRCFSFRKKQGTSLMGAAIRLVSRLFVTC